MSARRRTFLVFFALCGAFAACDSEDYSESRLIDVLCERDQCAVEGSAHRVRGLTPDSCGFELGPSAGSVVFGFPIDVEPRFTNAAVDVLIAGDGMSSLGALSPQYEWRRVDVEPTSGARPQSARVEVAAGAHAKIADVRLVNLWLDDGACSISYPGRSRRAR